MASPLHDREQTGFAIYAVIQSLIDSQEALVEIGEKIEDEDLRRFFLAESLKRAEFRGELESLLNQEGVGRLRESPAQPRAVRRALAGLRKKPRGADDRMLLAIVEMGEDAAREAYHYAMHAFLPHPVRELLAAQAGHIQQTHDFARAAQERAA